MLTRDELIRIEELKKTNPEFKYLFERQNEEHRFTISLMSHHIRNLLTMLISPFQLIEYFHPEVHDFKYWHECTGSISCTNCFLERLSDYNHCGEIEPQPCKLADMLQDFVISMKKEHQTVDISLILEDSCPQVKGDTMQLSHAMKQLFQNSCEALPEAEGKINLSLSHNDSFCTISITDNGAGFSNDMRQKLFMPFSTNKEQHSGLGLCIANRIVLAHKGYIRLAHTGTDGTCIEVCLPALAS